MDHRTNSSFADRIPENCLFWIALILFSMGAITTFYYQGTIAAKSMSRYVYIQQPVSQNERILTIYEEDAGQPRIIILTDDAGAVVEP